LHKKREYDRDDHRLKGCHRLFNYSGIKGKMPGTIVQIYEIQTPDEAEAMIRAGVHHVGSVIQSEEGCRDPVIRETVALVRRMGAVSSLIPLFSNPQAVIETLAYHRPHIVHFCDRMDTADDGGEAIEAAIRLQTAVRRRVADMRIMRSIPIARQASNGADDVLALASRLEPVSDYFLTDTVIVGQSGEADADQPVNGFVGITGLTCDWQVAARLVDMSRIPVILAGGISPQNVAEGIRRVRPYGVDSCTCTNAVDAGGRPIRFKKDLTRVRTLVAETRRADGMNRFTNPMGG
jgi:phosphoribosylanthranilate isomerase